MRFRLVGHSVGWCGGGVLAVAGLALAGFGQQAEQGRPDAIPVKNWPPAKLSAETASSLSANSPSVATGTSLGLVFVAITPCRVMDTRSKGGSGMTGPFGPPSLVANQPRVVPIPSSNCGVPVALAWSLNFVSITPVGVPVGYVAAWQDDEPWPGTVVLNADKQPERGRHDLGGDAHRGVSQ